MDLRHVAGEANQVADALLRPPEPPPPPFEEDFTHDFEPRTPPPTPSPPPSPSSRAKPTPTPSQATVPGRTGDVEVVAGSPTTCPSVIGVGDVRQVFYLAASLPAAEAGIDLAALQAAQLMDKDAAQLTRLKGFRFSFVIFKEVSLFCDVSTGTA